MNFKKNIFHKRLIYNSLEMSIVVTASARTVFLVYKYFKIVLLYQDGKASTCHKTSADNQFSIGR